jgi:phosphate-selective porin OprO/OprP
MNLKHHDSSLPCKTIHCLIVFAGLGVQSSLLAQVVEEGQHWFPDAPPAWAEATKYKNENFSVGFLFGALVDYTVFDQDQQSIDQVGIQNNELESRSARFLLAGTLDFIGPWSYVLTGEYNGYDRPSDVPVFNLMDASLTRYFADGKQRLTLGKQKQPFIYEVVGDSANLIQHERFLNPFFASRGWGVSYTHTYMDKKLGLQMGWYNDWFEEGGVFAGNGNQLVLRATGLPVWRDEGAQLLHVGISARYKDDEYGELQYRGRPGSNVTDFYVDSGSFEARHSLQMGLEALWQANNVTLLGEYARGWVTSHTTGNPQFDGYYVTASYIFNGQLRPYDTLLRYSRRVKPGAGWGALEPFVWFGRVNLDDAGIAGGKMNKQAVGVNWWATRRWKMSVSYGDIELDRFNLVGSTQQLLFRLQWIGP